VSRTKNQELRSWKDVLVRLRRIETTWQGTVLSRLDHDSFTEAILLTAMVLNDLSNRYEGCGSYRDHVNWAVRTASIDVGLLAAFLSDAIVLWRQLSEADVRISIDSFAGFKRQLKKEHAFAGVFLAPIEGAVEHFLSCPTASTFYPVYQFLSFLNHLTLVDIDMSKELEDKYLEQEVEVAAHTLPDAFIEEMNFVMRSWLCDFRMSEESFIPKHGPGAVAEFQKDISLSSKYKVLAPDSVIEYVFRNHMGVDAQSYAPLSTEGLITSRRCAIVFVPKSMKTKRVISKEPATLQYFQQGVQNCVRKYISQHSFLSSRIDFCRQEKQREIALLASRTREFATVDLSAASDSVSFELVKRVFAGTQLRSFLAALRSREAVLPSGKVVALAKYAPMGSALTFPIQTLIFACVCECTARYMQYETGDYDSRFRVYGDDIIIPDSHLETLVFYLRRCGFRINTSKTYGHSQFFRESCGCDAYDGVAVTPLRISRRFSARAVTARTPGVFEGLIDMANSSAIYEFSLLRRYLVDKLINESAYVPCFSEDGKHGLQSSIPTNYRLKRRWNADYQKEDLYAAKVSTTYSQSAIIRWSQPQKTFMVDSPSDVEQEEQIRLFEWLRRAATRSDDVDPLDPDFPIQVRTGSAGTYLARRWFDTHPG